MNKRVWILLACGLLAVLPVGLLEAQNKTQTTASTPIARGAAEKDVRAADRAAIHHTMKCFAEAFQKGDAVAAVAHLTWGAELIPADAEPVRGRDAIRQAFAAYFAKSPRAKIAAIDETVRFPSRDTAVDEGHLKVTPEKVQPTTNRYSVLYVREEGQWLLAQIREWADEHAELRDLDWLLGTWEANQPNVAIRATYDWFGDKSFVRGTIDLHDQERHISGMQLIGRDPGTGKLRLWVFESNGGFSAGTCTRDGNNWIFDTAGVLADGREVSATYLMVRVNQDTLTWQPVDLTLGGEPAAKLPPVKVTRAKGAR
jgi:uncharacterized protein (TIGR02246 family)